MAVIKNPTELDSPVSYVATLAFFCCVSCVVLMLKFRGFRASMDLSSWRKKENEIDNSITGAYRINRDEFFGSGSLSEPPKKLTPSMVKLPPSAHPNPNLRPTKSTSDLAIQNNVPQQSTAQMHRSTHDVSLDPKGRPATTRQENPAPERPIRNNKTQDKEQKKLEKQRLAEQKAREKAEAQEQARKDKIRREAEKKAAKERAKATKGYKKKAPPIPQAPFAPPPSTTPHVSAANPLASNPAPSYSTNTLESSISKTSGPPPYAEIASAGTNIAAGNSNPGNVSFSKPIDNPSWDMVSQHRQQMSRPATSAVEKGTRKNMVLDLQYKMGNDDANNTDA